MPTNPITRSAGPPATPPQSAAVLHLLHAFVWTELDVNIDPIPGMAGSGFRSAAHSLIQDAVALVRESRVEVPMTSEIVDGNAVPVLVEASEESDLLVLGGRGLGRLMTLIVGSKSLALAARAHAARWWWCGGDRRSRPHRAGAP